MSNDIRLIGKAQIAALYKMPIWKVPQVIKALHIKTVLIGHGRGFRRLCLLEDTRRIAQYLKAWRVFQRKVKRLRCTD